MSRLIHCEQTGPVHQSFGAAHIDPLWSSGWSPHPVDCSRRSRDDRRGSRLPGRCGCHDARAEDRADAPAEPMGLLKHTALNHQRRGHPIATNGMAMSPHNIFVNKDIQ